MLANSVYKPELIRDQFLEELMRAGIRIRRDHFAQALKLALELGLALTLVFAAGTGLHAQSQDKPATEQQWEMPSDAQRCPSKWGAKDEIGSGNLMKPEMALKAAKLIRTCLRWGFIFRLRCR